MKESVDLYNDEILVNSLRVIYKESIDSAIYLHKQALKRKQGQLKILESIKN